MGLKIIRYLYGRGLRIFTKMTVKVEAFKSSITALVWISLLVYVCIVD